MTDLAKRDQAALMEQVLVVGDLERLTPAQRLQHILNVCEAVGVNPATRPFEYIRLQGKLTLYARKDCTDQLRRIHGVSVVDVKEHIDDERGIYIVWTYVATADGRTDREMGAVNIKGLQGDALVNALMKGVTKSKRRATLAICGLGMLDETELETIPHVERVETPAPPAQPQQPAPGTAATLYCEECRMEIRDVPIRGQATMSAEEVAKRSKDTYGKRLCMPCAMERAAELDAQVRASKTAKPAQVHVSPGEPLYSDDEEEQAAF